MVEKVLNKKDITQFINGFDIDLDEGWRKLISRQFGGPPGRGFGELIQNLLDSYPSDIPWQERRGEIRTSEKSISITDYGEGMNRSRLRLLTTLGGTDKAFDPSKIGAFGIGFFSIFSPGLGTTKVIVTTRCETHTVRLTYDVAHPEKRPEISACVLDDPIRYSTRIEVTFNRRWSVECCVNYARTCLKNYPCRITINGQTAVSIWETAESDGASVFLEDHCHGFFEPGSWSLSRVRLMCKYQYLMTLSVPSLITGGHSMTHDLKDFRKKQIPFVPKVDITLNCNNLMVTISRDNFFLNTPYHDMIKILGKYLQRRLYSCIENTKEHQLILANQYILSEKLKAFLSSEKHTAGDTLLSEEDRCLMALASAKIYRLASKKQLVSLIDLLGMSHTGKPFFFSVEQTNIRWAKKAFYYDFILLPQPVILHNGAPGFYETLLCTIFGEVINLDTVMGDNERIKKLIERGIASKSALSPQYRFIGKTELTGTEERFLKQIDTVLSHKLVRQTIEKNLFIRFDTIQPVFFHVEEQGIVLSTGMFDSNGKALEEADSSNLVTKNDGKENSLLKKSKILLGLSRQHPFINHLLEARDDFKVYYALIFLVSELSLCQKLLVPYSPFYHVTTRRLTGDMRKVLMQILLERPDDNA